MLELVEFTLAKRTYNESGEKEWIEDKQVAINPHMIISFREHLIQAGAWEYNVMETYEQIKRKLWRWIG